MYNDETLKLARNYLGLNQKSFAEKLKISQGFLSNIEKGIKPINNEIVDILENEFGKSFFQQNMNSPLLKVYYRTSATVAKKHKDLFEARLQIISNNIDEMLEYVNIPENKLPKIDLEDFNLDSEYVANEVRDYFGLGRKPIDDIVRLLERHGVVIYFFDYDFISSQNKNFDGVSFFASGVPIILINKKIQNARKVFTIAHEVAHLIFHNHQDFIISRDRDIEKEANEFASEFIAPQSSLRGEFNHLTLEKLFQLKSYWKLSIGALLYKAKKMTLSYDQYRRWVTKLAPFRKHEPNDFDINEPILLKKMFEIFDNDMKDEDEFYDKLGCSKKLYANVYSTLIEKPTPKVKIIL